MLSEPPFEALFENVKHHAAVQSARKRYISRRVEILNNFLRIFFTTAAVPFTRALNRGVMLHMSKIMRKKMFKAKVVGNFTY